MLSDVNRYFFVPRSRTSTSSQILVLSISPPPLDPVLRSPFCPSNPQVRGCPIEERVPLRTPGPEWETAFLKYLSKIDCPYNLTAGGNDTPGTHLF